MAEKILVVDDNRIMRLSLARLLEAELYDVVLASDGEEALEQYARVSPDLVVMDINMPRMNGLEALRRLREFSQVPVLILSVRNTEPDKVTGLDVGADDYLTKPFGAAELLARVRALLRRQWGAGRTATEGPDVVRLGGGELLIDRRAEQVLNHGQSVHLTPQESRLLFTLAQRPGQPFDHSELIKAVWGDDPAGTIQSLKLYVLYLRRKIEPDPGNPCYIITVRGAGYMLAAR
jgi:two-component system KDP operon response regulator KdpE